MMPKDILSATAAAERMELYCLGKPRSPSAVRRPKISIRAGVWVALLGESVQTGIVGLGATLETALAAFDEQYDRKKSGKRSKTLRPRRKSRNALIGNNQLMRRKSLLLAALRVWELKQHSKNWTGL